MPVDIPGFLYAGAIAAGGIFGYYKAGSLPSLAAGIVFGTVLVYGAYQSSQSPANHAVTLVTSSLLTGIMGYRFYNTGKIMPAGIVCILSAVMVARTAVKSSGVLNTYK